MYRRIFAGVLFCLLSCVSQGDEKTFLRKVMETDLSVDEKAEMILAEMTYDEKVSFINGSAWKIQGEVKRLGLPAVSMQDSTMGISFHGTSFPSTLIVTSSWDRAAMAAMAEAVAKEGKARGERVILGPGVNIYRMPNCGRNFEYMGEDPFLTSEMTIAYVRAMQSQNVVSCVKHFLANNQDFDRHGTSSDIDERTMREIYLPPFEAAVRAGVGSVMTGYNPVNGFPMSENKYLMTDILKNEWGFKGFIVSDWMSVYSTEGPFVSGLDLEMPVGSPYYDAKCIAALNLADKEKLLDDKVFRILRTYIEKGLYDGPQIDDSLEKNPEEHDKLARRLAEEGIVLLKNQDNILPVSQTEPRNVVLVGANSRNLNTTTVGACTVFSGRPGRLMTVNALSGFKPYRDRETKIRQCGVSDVVTIKNADVVLYFAGLWVFGEGEANDRNWEISERNRKEIHKLSKLNPNLVVVSNYGGGIETESWLHEVKGFIQLGFAGKWADAALARIVFGDVNPSGKLPYTMVKKWEDFGPVAAQVENPDKLVIWPKDTKYRMISPLGTGRFKVFGGDPKMLKSAAFDRFEYSPDVYDRMDRMEYAEGRYLGYRFLDKVGRPAQFPFGFGLSYTEFEITGLRVSRKSFDAAQGTDVTVTVKNTGERAGAEVVQLYVHDPVSRLDRVYKELKGFEKIFLNPGEAKTVTMSLTEESFRYYDDTQKKWVVEPGQFDILIGNSSENLPLRTSVTVR